MPKTNTPPTYVRLLNLLSAIRDISPFNAMSAEEERLLGDLIIRWHSQKSISVSDIMHAYEGPSASTIYRRLMALHKKGLVDLVVDKHDRRVSLVQPTALTDKYAKSISEGLKSLVAQKAQ